MRRVVEITLPTIPYDKDISDIVGYLRMVLSELTKTSVEIQINDIDFTNKIGVFNKNRRRSFPNRQNNQ
jgi:hypothetical protein